MKKILCYFISCLCLLSFNLRAQSSGYKYNFVNIKGAVSKVGIYSINQDEYGFIWMATNGAGLYRFDGIDYDYYKHDLNDSTSISSNLVYCTYLDHKDRLWVGTEEGLNLYDRENDQFKRIPISDFTQETDSISNIAILSLADDGQGNLFAGSFENGLFKLKLDSFKIEKIKNIDDETYPIIIEKLSIDKTGKVYAATDRGLKEYNYKTNMLKQSVFDNGEEKISIKVPIESLLVDEDNTIWIGTVSNGLYKVKQEGNKNFKIDKFPVSKNRFLSMIALSDGTLLCGTENDGLIHIDKKGNVLYNYLSSKINQKSILSNSIWSLFLDKEGRVWMGYYNMGVAVYDELYDKFDDIESSDNNSNSLQIGSVTSVIQDSSGKLWIGMDGGGIDVLDVKSNRFNHINLDENSKYSGLTSNYIEVLFVDSNQNIWAGSWDKGLFVLEKGSKKFINYNVSNTNGDLRSNTILSIAEDSEGIIWIGSFYGGLHAFNIKTKKITHYNTGAFLEHGLANSDVRKLLIDSKDNLWVGITTGLFKIKKQNDGRFLISPMSDKMSKQYKNHTSASHILSIYEGSNNLLWIGTRGAGLCKYDYKTDTFTWYNESEGLKEENVCGIIESIDGNIWLSGNSGISKLDMKTNEFTNYTNNDGLLSNDYNINATFRDHKGKIYFGNYLGVDYFQPDEIKVNSSLASLYLTDFKLFNKKIHPSQKDSPLKKVISETDSISLNSRQSVFTIEYSGINYTRPEKIEYAYYLDGYEESWNYVGNVRSATYTNLDPGDYIFKLKAANNDGVWNESPLHLNITILPPWWKTIWAIASYIFLFLLGLFILNKMTQSRIKEKELINNERSKRLQEKELNEKKFQFFTNISHEFRTPLTLIMNPIEDIINDKSLKLPERVKEKHHTIYKNTDRIYRLINELLDFRKLELNKVKIRAKELNLVSFTKNVVSHFKEEAFVRNIHLSVDADVLDLSVWVDEDMMEKIIFNILSNAFKVTSDGGAINVDLISKDELVNLPLIYMTKPTKVIELVISDTGPGLKKGEVKKIFERFYQVENLNKTYYGGTGIGLEVVQSFVQLHKGKIEVKSKVGKGTSFRILLPTGKSHFSDAEIVSEGKEVLTKKEQFLRSNILLESEKDKALQEETSSQYTLLIVEDNTELRNYLKEELKGIYKILVAGNGKEGLEQAKKSLPDIIITDVIMPEMDGFNFCKNIKSDMRTSHIPLLMLTAKTTIDNRMEGIELGADAYMVKPFNLRLLKLRLSQLITSRQLIFNKYFSVISDVPSNVKTTSLDKEFIDKVLNYINKNIGNPDLSVESLAMELNLSRSQFYRKVKALTNQTASEFLRNIRLQKAKQIIEMGNTNISDVCFKIGFSSPSYFTKCFKSYFGMLPTEVQVVKS